MENPLTPPDVMPAAPTPAVIPAPQTPAMKTVDFYPAFLILSGEEVGKLMKSRLGL